MAEWRGTNSLKSFSFSPVVGSTIQGWILLLLPAPRLATLGVYQEYSCFSKPKGVHYYSFGQKCIKTTSWQILVPRIIEFLETGKALETIQFNALYLQIRKQTDVRTPFKVIQQISGKTGSRPFHSLPVLFSLHDFRGI